MRVAYTIVALGCLALTTEAAAPFAHAQTSGTPCSAIKDANGQPLPNPACAGTAAPSAPRRFPYPGESTSAVPPDAPAAAASPAANSVPASQNIPAATAPGQAPAGRRFPYPGEAAGSTTQAPTPNTGASAGDPGGLKDAGSSGESSSSSSSAAGAANSDSSSSSSNPNGDGASGSPFTDPDAGDTPAPKRARKKLPPVPRQTPSEREEEDVRIAGFYQNTGNYKAAYDRAQDAVSLSTDDPDAHLAFAEAARKLGKLDEAQQHYRKCLDLDPIPKTRRVAERALKEMSGGA